MLAITRGTRGKLGGWVPAIPAALLLTYLAGMQENTRMGWRASVGLNAQVLSLEDTRLRCAGCLLGCCPPENVSSGTFIPLLAKHVATPCFL